ncbi:MAG: hypothetical protein FWG37_04850 [Clostridia bacterium]|nr:hypothetical protein [Clostridia bacterium]
MTKQGKKRTLLHVPMYLWAVLFTALPLLYIVGISFFERDPSWGINTDKATLLNYRQLFNPSYLRVFTESIVLSGLASLSALLIGYPFAYMMAKSNPKRRILLRLFRNCRERVYF